MLFNKNKYKKINDKKVLHKIGKHWAVVSIAMLGLLAGGAATTGTTTHADANTSVGQNAEVNTHKPASASNKVMLGASNAQSSANANSVSASSNVSNKASSASTSNRPQVMFGATRELGNPEPASLDIQSLGLNDLKAIGSAVASVNNSSANDAYTSLMSEAQPNNVKSFLNNFNYSDFNNTVSTVASNVNELSAIDNVSGVSNFSDLNDKIQTAATFVKDSNGISNLSDLDSALAGHTKALNVIKEASVAVNDSSEATNLSNALNEFASYAKASGNSDSISNINNSAANLVNSFSNDYNSALNSANYHDALNSMFTMASNSANDVIKEVGGTFSDLTNLIGSASASSFDKTVTDDIASAASYASADLASGSNSSAGSSFATAFDDQISALSMGKRTLRNMVNEFTNGSNSSVFNSFINVAQSDASLKNAIGNIAQLSNASNASEIADDFSNATSNLANDSNLANISAVSAANSMFSSTAASASSNYNTSVVNSQNASNEASEEQSAADSLAQSESAASDAAQAATINSIINGGQSNSSEFSSNSNSGVVNFGGNTTSASNNNETQPVNHHHNKKSSHHYNVKNVPVGKSFKFDGMKATRVTTKKHYDYRYASKNIWLHTNLNMTRRNHRATLRKGSEFIVDKLFKLTTRHHHTYYRALINYGGRHDAFAYINGRNSKNMYYYATKHGEHYVYLRKGVEVHRNARFSRHSNVRYLRAHRTYRLHKIVKFGKFGLTRIQLSKNRFITANRKFVKLV